MVGMLGEGWRIGACGLNCAACDIYAASHGDEEKRASLLKWFREERGLDLRPEQIRCEGCRCPPELNWSEDCPMQRCASEKGHEYCFECGGFPCGHLEMFAGDGAEHHRRTVDNLREMKRLGLDEWIRRQGKPAFCP